MGKMTFVDFNMEKISLNFLNTFSSLKKSIKAKDYQGLSFNFTRPETEFFIKSV